MKNEKQFKLSNQALGAIMMALQESLMSQIDIVPLLQGFELQDGKDGLVVMNPPTIRLSNDEAVTNEDLEDMVN